MRRTQAQSTHLHERNTSFTTITFGDFFSNKERFIKILVWRWRLRIFWYDWWLTISPLHFVFLAVYSSPERMSEESTRAAKQNKRTAQKKNKK
jgi:hypothetical protein